MSAGSSGKGRRGARTAGDTSHHARRLHEPPMLNGVYQTPSLPYYPMPGPYYQGAQAIEHMPYMLPYNAYQHPQRIEPQYQTPQSLQRHEVHVPEQISAYAANTPPTKRLRTDPRYVQPTARQAESGRKTPSLSQRSTPSKGTPNKSTSNRKTFSDFRMSSIKIGTWSHETGKDVIDTRDSRIRFCFRNGNDKDADSTLSATEAALVSPDRISISVANGSRRIIIPANHIKSIEFRRRAGEISIETDGWAAFERSLDSSDRQLVLHSPSAKSTPPISAISWELTEDDITHGQMSIAKSIQIKLDQHRPLTEPKWTRGSLAEHLDVNSRFLKILKIMDTEVLPTLETFLDEWAGDDSNRAYFYEYHLTSGRLVELLTSLMSSNNVLTPAIKFLIDRMLALIKSSDIEQTDLLELLRQGVFLIPSHMLRMSLDSIYAEFCLEEDPQLDGGAPVTAETPLGGSKRQRGESEVPSEQLARTTLDEKRRRLSESEPQLPHHVKEQRSQAQSRSKSRVRSNSGMPGSIPMHISKSHESALPKPKLEVNIQRSNSSAASCEDGARMSREEMLKALEDCEELAASSDNEQDVPIAEASVVEHISTN